MDRPCFGPNNDEELTFVEPDLLTRVHRQLSGFPGDARIRLLTLLHKGWTVDDGLLIPTLNMKRERIARTLKDEIAP